MSQVRFDAGGVVIVDDERDLDVEEEERVAARKKPVIPSSGAGRTRELVFICINTCWVVEQMRME